MSQQNAPENDRRHYEEWMRNREATMSTVGLTKARERDLRLVLGGRASIIPQGRINGLTNAGFLDASENVTPRGRAALAAPRMTQKEYVFLSWVERGEWAVYSPANQRIFDSCSKQGWVNLGGLTPAGRTALNNVRAAMPGEWKELP